MNNDHFEINQNIYPSLDLQPNSTSSPSLSNPSTQNPDTSEEIDDQMITDLLLQYLDQNNPKDFRATLSSYYNLLSKNSIEYIFSYILKLYISDKIFASRFLSILIPFGINPNKILNEIYYKIESKDKNEEYNPSESILMLFCSKSNSTLISYLCESKIQLDVNYLDIKKRNALFYLKGGKEDKKIIELLVEKGINVNQRDIDGNTALHNAIINIGKRQLVYDLIDIGNANFMIKNSQNLNSLEFINLKWISKKNINYNKFNIIDYKEIKELIELINKKLSIILYRQQTILKNKDHNNNSVFDLNNLIKFPSIKINNNINESNQDIIEKNGNRNNLENNNIFLKLNNNNPSLIIDTQFNDELDKPLSKKIEYYSQINKSKKFFINLLKTSDNFLLEKSKELKNDIEAK